MLVRPRSTHEKRIQHIIPLTNHHIAIIVQMSRVVNSVFLEFSPSWVGVCRIRWYNMAGEVLLLPHFPAEISSQ